MRSLHRWSVAAKAAGLLSVGVPLVVPSLPANAAVGTLARDTTTVTATCGNGLIVLGPVVLFAAPSSTTVIQCEQSPPLAGATS